MKKLFILLSLCMCLTAASYAQSLSYDSASFYNMFSVNAGSNNITPDTNSTPGLSPLDSFLAPAIRGQLVNDTIYFTNYTNVNYHGTSVPLNSLTIDSLYLPSGLTWSTNQSGNTFTSGAKGVLYVTGITYDSVGQYKLRIIVSATVGGVIPLNDINAETYTGLAYRVRVIDRECATPGIDNSSADSARVFIPYSCDTGNATAGINAISNDISGVSIQPNPFTSTANMVFNSSVEGAFTLRMTNLIGAVVSSEEVSIKHGSNNFTIERNGLSSGIYLLSISNGSSSITRKVIIE